jgi:hypothetical protein
MAELSEEAQTRLAVASLAAALVKALDERLPGIQSSFEDNLRKLYDQGKEVEFPSIGALETIKWTGELLLDLK